MNSIKNEPLINKIVFSEFKDKKMRSIFIGEPESKKKLNKFPNNKITTTKY
jgi:hypothetical protein